MKVMVTSRFLGYNKSKGSRRVVAHVVATNADHSQLKIAVETLPYNVWIDSRNVTII